MADPSSKAAELQKTYVLTVPVHDLMGDAPTASSNIVVTLVRADGDITAPLFGPQGLIVGGEGIDTITPTARDSSEISEGLYVFRLLPNAYYFVPTVYELTAGARTYQFTMPSKDSTLIELLNEEASGGETDGGTTPATVHPDVESVKDAAELLAAEGASGEPIFARVSADFATWHTGDVLVWTGEWSLLVRTSSLSGRTLGTMRAWFQPLAAVDASGAPTATLREGERGGVTLTHAASTTKQYLTVAFPDSLDSRLQAILIDGARWDGAGRPLLRGATETLDGVAHRLYRTMDATVDVSKGADLWVEVVLGAAS